MHRKDRRMTDRVPYYLLALGWLLVLWGLADLFGWWVYPLGAGFGCMVAGLCLAGWRNLEAVVFEGGMWEDGKGFKLHEALTRVRQERSRSRGGED